MSVEQVCDAAVREEFLASPTPAGSPPCTRREWTRELQLDHAHHVCGVLLPEAPGCSVGELITRVQAVAASLDPDWA